MMPSLNQPSDNNMNPVIKYYQNGKIKSELWLINNEYHRLNGPAFQQWYKNGQIEYEGWYQNNKFHRTTGPAFQQWDSNGRLINEFWYKNGIDKTKEIKKFIKQYPLPENEVLFKLTFG